MQEIVKFFEAKKSGFKQAERKSLEIKVNGRSADYIMPSFAVGCELGCTYCYVARHREFGNPVTLYSNVDKMLLTVENHWKGLPEKSPNQCDPEAWTYDIGESTDCMSPLVLPTTNKVIDYLVNNTGVKPTFATKLKLNNKLIDVPKNKARVRMSLMPQKVASVVEAGTSSISSRIASVDKLIAKGYEVHINFSPVIGYKGWTIDYAELMQEIDNSISEEAKNQLKCEVIFLTHSPKLHNLNMTWNQLAEKYLWAPDKQEFKTNNRGNQDILRYKAFTVKQYMESTFVNLLEKYLPYCTVRYIF
jgi:DNA repair photolyase